MRYAITGPYCDVNYGDYAMLPNNLAAFPEEPHAIFVFDQGFTRSMLEDYGLAGSANFVDVKVTTSAAEVDPRSAITPLELLQHVTNLDEVREAVRSVDLVVVNGGGYINDLWAQPHRMLKLLSILAPAVIASQLGKPVRFTANGFGPFIESADFFASILGRMQDLCATCRDALGSQAWLRRLGIAEDKIQLAPDDLIVMDKHLTLRTPGWTAPTVGDYIVVETYRPVEELQANMQALLVLQEALGAEVVLLPMNRAHGGEDQAATLAKVFPHAHLYPLSEVGYLPVEDALHAIRGARLTVTDRYHGLVTALAANAPVVSIIRPVRGSLDYYYRKNAGALEWRLAPGSYDESDFVRLSWADLPTTEASLTKLADRQSAAYAASTAHFDITLSVRQALIKGIFSS